MYKDPVIDELRQNAAKLIEECDHDVHKVAERLRQEQSHHPARVVRRRGTTRTPHPKPPEENG